MTPLAGAVRHRLTPPAPTPPLLTERSPRARQIVDAASTILEDEGLGGLTMRRVGAALGIRAPSLYKHLAGRPALELALVEDGLARMGTALHRSVDVAPHARITSLLDAYRATGLGGPELYRLATSASFPRAGLPDGLEAWAGEPFFLAAGEPYLAQALWSFAHGTMLLELDRRFLDGSEVTRTWEAGAGAFEAARQALAGLPAQPHVR